MIIETILLLVINSLYIIGLTSASMIEWKTNSPNRITKKTISIDYIDVEHSQILWKLRYYILKTFGFKWSKPLISCPTCMASFHGTLFYLLVVRYYFNSVYVIDSQVYVIMYFIYILCLAGLNTIFSKFID